MCCKQDVRGPRGRARRQPLEITRQQRDVRQIACEDRSQLPFDAQPAGMMQEQVTERSEVEEKIPRECAVALVLHSGKQVVIDVEDGERIEIAREVEAQRERTNQSGNCA